MMKTRAWARPLVVTVLAALLGVLPLSAQSAAKKRTPPAPSSGTAQKRKPPAPSGHGVPRPATPKPSARPPDRPRPYVPPAHGTYIYPFTPFAGFDFVYRFPFGPYPYSRYGYPEYPYRFIFPPPGCVTTELESHGGVRIDVPQREAVVHVDGFYVGVVEDFNGAIEHLNLTPGPHRIELHAPGFETTGFDVNLEAGQLIVYRTPMRPGGLPRGTAQP